jgi:hypothetical protein
MREFLAELWLAAGSAPSCEFVAAFAKPYPALTISAVLGAPREDAERVHDWSTWVQRQFDIRALGTDLARIEGATAEVYDYAEAPPFFLPRAVCEPCPAAPWQLVPAECEIQCDLARLPSGQAGTAMPMTISSSSSGHTGCRS